ncbi:MAG TPA: sugar ABC transporter permease [Ktedonobacterales bacterium]
MKQTDVSQTLPSLLVDKSLGIPRPRQRRRWGGTGRHNIAVPYVLLTPFLVVFFVFFVLPLLYALYLSVFVDRLVGGTIFVGIGNYIQVFHDPNFWSGVGRMLLFGVVQVPIMLGLALIFALLLDSGMARFKTLFRLGYFLPYAIPSVVGALMWGYLYGPTFGPFAQMAHALHAPPPGFLTEGGLLWSIANIVTWEFIGYNMIIMFSALQAVPQDLYDAARVDGATGWQVARHIKVPLIMPAIILTCIFSIIGTLQLFNEPSILTPIARDVIQDHYTPNLYAYTLAFTNQQYSYSAAVSFTLGFVVFVGSYLFMFLTNRGRR